MSTDMVFGVAQGVLSFISDSLDWKHTNSAEVQLTGTITASSLPPLQYSGYMYVKVRILTSIGSQILHSSQF